MSLHIFGVTLRNELLFTVASKFVIFTTLSVSWLPVVMLLLTWPEPTLSCYVAVGTFEEVDATHSSCPSLQVCWGEKE